MVPSLERVCDLVTREARTTQTQIAWHFTRSRQRFSRVVFRVGDGSTGYSCGRGWRRYRRSYSFGDVSRVRRRLAVPGLPGRPCDDRITLGSELMSNARLPRSWNRREVLGAGCLLLGGALAPEPRRQRSTAGRRPDSRGSVPTVQDGASELFAARAEKRWQSGPGQGPGRDQGAGPSLLGVVPRPRADERPARPRETPSARSPKPGSRSPATVSFTWATDADANRRIFEFAKSLGLEYVSADLDPGAFDAIDKLVEEFGVGVGIHNHGPGHRYAKIETISDAIKDHHQKIGCCIDTGHFLRSRDRPRRRRGSLRRPDLRGAS